MTGLQVSGGCYCGNIRLTVTLSQEPSSYRPRACDCDFCRKHGAAYVSDAQGELRIQIRDEAQVSRFRQGSNTAEMLICRTCGVLVGALHREAERLFGTVNAQALDCRGAFGAEQSVSPKLLPAEQKVLRWRDLWFKDVAVTGQTPI